jgi:hypothetical protein
LIIKSAQEAHVHLDVEKRDLFPCIPLYIPSGGGIERLHGVEELILMAHHLLRFPQMKN